jgi:hypothetical protein
MQYSFIGEVERVELQKSKQKQRCSHGKRWGTAQRNRTPQRTFAALGDILIIIIPPSSSSSRGFNNTLVVVSAALGGGDVSSGFVCGLA